MTTEITEQDEQDLAAAEVAPNSDQYDGLELRRAISKIIERHTRCTCGNPDAGNPNVGRAVHNYDGTPCYIEVMKDSTPVVPDNPLKLAVATVLETNFGDHGERVTTFHESIPGETVDEMVYRLFPALTDNWRKHNVTDEIVIKVILNKDGTVSGEIPLGQGLAPF